MMLVRMFAATVLLCAALIEAKPTGKTHKHGPSFVKVNGLGFELNGRPYYQVGANYWYGMNLGATEEWGGNRTRLENELRELRALGINNLRIMGASEGPDNQPFRMKPALMEKPGHYNEPIFEGLDYFLYLIAKYDMKAIVTLTNFWHWSGGFSQYVNWATNNITDIPYPPSWQQDPINAYSNGSWSDFQIYAARFYNDSSISAQCQTWFKDHIQTLINRKNKFTSKLYKDDDTIMAWELCNEPQMPPKSWIDGTSSFIKRLAPNQLVTTGLEGKYGKWDFVNAHSSKTIDFSTCHCWVENWGKYDPTNSSAANYDAAHDFAMGFIQNCSDWSSELNKPVVLEEFGMARDAWKGYKYNPGTPTTNKIRYYEAIFTKILELEKRTPSTFAGQAFWAYGGDGRPAYPPNKFGIRWLGDPPHEPPGWYDVFNNDTITRIIADNAKAVHSLMN